MASPLVPEAMPLVMVLISCFVLVQRASAGVSIYGYSGNRCDVIGTGCDNMKDTSCCDIGESDSVMSSVLEANMVVTVFPTSVCLGRYVFYFFGPGRDCYIERTPLRAATWFFNNSLELANDTSTPARSNPSCNRSNALSFSTALEGTWTLKTGSDSLQQVREELEKIPDDHKIAWMRRAGATYLGPPPTVRRLNGHSADAEPLNMD